jgi:diketogulonate reductase-like aldo/keto reductase
MGYGLGTARSKGDANAPLDKELVKTVVMAIKAGYYHVDGAQGKLFSSVITLKILKRH